jgi:Protein of unknown function (DUF3102)
VLLRKAEKPATAETVNGLRIVEQLCGRLENQDTRSVSEIQAFVPENDHFDYGGFPADVAAALKMQACNIRKLANNSMSAIITAGQELLRVKDQLDHGQFGPWVQSECGFSLSTAENFMRASNLISGQNRNCVAILQLQPSTVYRLAAKGTPAGVVDSVIERGERGEVVSDKQVLAALDEVRRQRCQDARKSKPKPLSKGQDSTAGKTSA